MSILGSLLGSEELAERLRLSGHASSSVLAALEALGDQAFRMGIDYETLGRNWNHPKTRRQYRLAEHDSTTCFSSRQRAEVSRTRLADLVTAIVSGSAVAETCIVDTFLREIGVPTAGAVAEAATFEGVAAALKAELLLPLRALQEGQRNMHKTYTGEPIPPHEIARTVEAIIAATLSKPGGFSEWRYSNAVGVEQLRGLSQRQLTQWREPTSRNHDSGLRTHEDEPGELGLFWATKIGGPSHGFDIEGPCILPLLANARTKVLLVSDPAWPNYPVGRAHLRLLWTAPVDEPSGRLEARLWLEAVNCDFDAKDVGIDHSALQAAALRHAVEKSEAMGLPLSVDPKLSTLVAAASREQGFLGNVEKAQERLTLRPSNVVCEASDYLSNRHDWVQMGTEITEPIERAVYRPASRT